MLLGELTQTCCAGMRRSMATCNYVGDMLYTRVFAGYMCHLVCLEILHQQLLRDGGVFVQLLWCIWEFFTRGWSNHTQAFFQDVKGSDWRMVYSGQFMDLS